MSTSSNSFSEYSSESYENEKIASDEGSDQQQIDSMLEEPKELSQQKVESLMKDPVAILNSNRFPVELYLKDVKNEIGISEGLKIFGLYFRQSSSSKIDNCGSQAITRNCYLLNRSIFLRQEGLCSPTKYVFIYPFDDLREQFVVRGGDGKVVMVDLFKRKHRRMTIIDKISKKLPMKKVVVYDLGPEKSKFITERVFKNLPVKVRMLYFRTLDSQQELKALPLKMKDHREIVAGGRKIYLKVKDGKQGQKMFCVSSDCSSKPIDQKQQIEDFDKAEQQINQLLTIDQMLYSYANTEWLGRNLRVFDALIVNYWRFLQRSSDMDIQISKNEENYLLRQDSIRQCMEKMRSELEQNYEQIQGDKPEEKRINTGDHFPASLQKAKPCRNCQIVNKSAHLKAKKRSKFKCMGCSKKYDVEFSLCLGCFGAFHQQTLPRCKDSPLNSLKDTYNQAIIDQQAEAKLRQKAEQSRKQVEDLPAEQSAQLLINLHYNFLQITQLLDQLRKQSKQGEQLSKKINNVMFITIMDSLNLLMIKERQTYMIPFMIEPLVKKEEFN